jgi:hypothetical protein
MHSAIAILARSLAVILASAASAQLSSAGTEDGTLVVPGFTAYADPDPNGVRISVREGISNWTDPRQSVSWFGEFRRAGGCKAAISITAPAGKTVKFRLSADRVTREASAKGTGQVMQIDFGEVPIAAPGYVRFRLESLNQRGLAGMTVDSLILGGSAVEGAHFNLDPRRNAASVHLGFPVPPGVEVAAFYNEITAIEDPVATYYMACGFSRGYFGMQVISETERRIIFSVWDSGAGGEAMNRSSVAREDHVSLLAKGEGVHASVFGNEGTGGHSHLKTMWRTGEAQRFVTTAKPDGAHTDYSGYWFHPEKRKWMLIASFRAPKDGKWLRGLYSFSENFNGSNGHLPRKALFGPQWVRTSGGEWIELTRARFSHDETGKSNRMDRFMGLEKGLFFLAHGGFVPGFTQSGETSERPPLGKIPDFP